MAMASITVRLYASLREAAGRENVEVDADSVESALDRLSSECPGLSAELARARASPEMIVVLVDGRTVRRESWSTRLHDGAEVALFPPVSGG
jgi:MoaD family protein